MLLLVLLIVEEEEGVSEGLDGGGFDGLPDGAELVDKEGVELDRVDGELESVLDELLGGEDALEFGFLLK
jgi:hypothetical protein